MFSLALKFIYRLFCFSSVSSNWLSVVAEFPLRQLSSLFVLIFVAALDAVIVVGFWDWVMLIGNIFEEGVSEMMEGDGPLSLLQLPIILGP